MLVLGMCVAGIGILLIIDSLMCVYRTIKERIRLHYIRQAHRDIAGSIESTAWWFCEDEPTEALLNSMAHHIREYGTVYPNELRNEWRKSVTQLDK